MPVPNLLHPVPIQVQQLDTSETYQDDDYREPVQQAAHGETKTVQGQVLWSMKEALSVRLGGVEMQATGYVLFRYVDLSDQSIVLAVNDRLIKLGTLEVDVYVIKLQPMGHNSDVGGSDIG